MKYHDITKDDMKNGDGLRVVLWVSGCPHHCKGCHNPITWDPDDGIIFDEKAKQEIYDELDKDYISGLTISGGDPLSAYNFEEVCDFVEDVKERYPNKTIWIYTGFTFEQLMNRDPQLDEGLFTSIDVLVDGEFVESLKDPKLLWKGSSNQRVIDTKKTFGTYEFYVDDTNVLMYSNDHVILHCGDYEDDPINTIKCKGCGE